MKASELLWALRSSLGLSQADTAKLLGCVRTSVTNKEYGRQAVSVADLEALSLASGVVMTLCEGEWSFEWRVTDDRVGMAERSREAVDALTTEPALKPPNQDPGPAAQVREQPQKGDA